jgi:selenide,water dikinase
MEKTTVKLTEFTKGGGCGCKIPPAALAEILSEHRTGEANGLIVGNSSGDDCAVIEIGEDRLLISTTDFFTPIVDDPYDFGRIAAANSISDIYSMGGTPVLAISILAWPLEKLDAGIASEVIRGARDICAESGIMIGGGHSIENPEPVFGLAVNGILNKSDLKRNNTAKSGDLLFITKPIGSGMMSAALKKGSLQEELKEELIYQMSKLNTIGRDLGGVKGVTAMTDVTGFGLIGHLLEMCDSGRLSASIRYTEVPLMNGVRELAGRMIYPDNTMRNWKAFGEQVSGISGESLLTLCDPQTNGGLLVAVDPSSKEEVEKLFNNKGWFFREIGQFMEPATSVIVIE